jgi:flavin reductase (DIM6/NTAB) family NADH-FMN oxidoreductase RutF
MEAAAYRDLMKSHAGTLVVVATGWPGGRTGLTATAFCSVSDSPPTILICVNKTASAHPVIRSTKAFSVNVLGVGQEDVAACFAGRTGLKGEQRFDLGEWATLQTGAPVMADALGNLDCELIQEHEHGSHSVFIGLVRAIRSMDSSDPLMYCRGDFSALQHRNHKEFSCQQP